MGATRTLLLITGMRDNRCRESVAGVLERVLGVKEVHVNLFRARATIIHEPPCAPADLIAAMARAGYGAALGNSRRGMQATEESRR